MARKSHLALSVAALAALALGACERPQASAPRELLIAELDHPADWSCTIELTGAGRHTYTRVLSEKPLESYPELSAPAAVRLSCTGSKLYAVISAAPELRCDVEQVGVMPRRQPNGQVHTLRHLLLSCEAKQHGNKTVLLLLLEADTAAGTLDVIPCGITPTRYRGLSVQDYHTPGSDAELPSKISGSPIRQDMLRMLYLLAAVSNHEQAEAAGQLLTLFAYRLGEKAPYPAEPWPRTWGDQAEDARLLARRLTPTLVYLQEHACFESDKLTAFINSRIFSSIFGERFTELPGERLQEQPIPFIRLQEEPPPELQETEAAH